MINGEETNCLPNKSFPPIYNRLSKIVHIIFFWISAIIFIHLKQIWPLNLSALPFAILPAWKKPLGIIKEIQSYIAFILLTYIDIIIIKWIAEVTFTILTSFCTLKNSTSCYPFRLKEQNITGKLKAGNKKKLSPFNNDSISSFNDH